MQFKMNDYKYIIKIFLKIVINNHKIAMILSIIKFSFDSECGWLAAAVNLTK